MKRYILVAIVTILLLLTVAGGAAYLAKANSAQNIRPLKQIYVYTTLPAELTDVLTASYEKEQGVRVNFISLSQADLLAKLDAQREADKKGDTALVLADERTLEQAAAAGDFDAYISETADQVPDDFRQADGDWVGVWYDPIVFAYNGDYLKTLTNIPDTWQKLAAMPTGRIGVTDFLAADASANLLYSMVAQFGEDETYDIWKQIHPKVVQYARYLSNPVRQAGMGEVEVAIAVESEALRYIQNGYPIKIVYPADGTARMLTGTALTVNSRESDRRAAIQFADWLLSDKAQMALESQGFYLETTNPDTLAYKRFAGKNIHFFEQQPQFTNEEQHAILDRWVKEVRIGNNNN